MTLIDALRSRDLEALRAAIAADPKGAGGARAVGEAGRLAWREAFELLAAAGADLNASFRNYRPLHALLQEDAHAASGKPTPERLACLEWLLEHGADPELTAAWPLARVDGFAGAALGDRKLVEKALAVNPGFPRERDGGVLTALHCAAGSRMPKADRRGIAGLLLDAGAEVNAKARSWSHDVDAIYFAAGTKDLGVFELLIERGADATDGLGCAVWSGAYELAESALAHGAKIDRATSNGKPLLNDVIRWGQFPQMFWLLEHGASCNVPDAEGWTVVHQAASRGNERALRAVLDAGGDKTLRDKSGQVPRDLTKKDNLAEMLKK